MRGLDEQTSSLFSYMSCEARVPASHPLRRIRAVVDEALDVLSPDFDDNLLFRWFVGLSMDAAVWDASTFSKNRDRFLDGDAAQRLLTAILDQPRVRALMSDEHFSVDQAEVTTQGRDQADAGKAGVGDQAAALQPAPHLQDRPPSCAARLARCSSARRGREQSGTAAPSAGRPKE